MAIQTKPTSKGAAYRKRYGKLPTTLRPGTGGRVRVETRERVIRHGKRVTWAVEVPHRITIGRGSVRFTLTGTGKGRRGGRYRLTKDAAITLLTSGWTLLRELVE